MTELESSRLSNKPARKRRLRVCLVFDFAFRSGDCSSLNSSDARLVDLIGIEPMTTSRAIDHKLCFSTTYKTPGGSPKYL